MRPVRDLALAFGFLTVLPVGRDWPEEGAPDAVGFYPWVGYGLGAAGWLAAISAAPSGPPVPLRSLVVAAVLVTLWALLTRMLHWDGLADAADGLWGSFDRERRLEIMRDSRVGSFGATAVVLTALLQVACVALVLERQRPWVLLLAPVLARAGAAVAAWMLPSARREGLGLTAMERPSLYAVAACSLAVVGLLVVGHVTAPRVAFFATFGAGVLAAVAVPRVLARPVGGMTGDLFGAGILLTETVVLLVGGLV